MVQSQTTIILGWTRCEGHGFRRISIKRHLASSHFQEARPRKFNVTPHGVDGEVYVSCCESHFTNIWLLYKPPVSEQTFTSGNEFNSLVSNYFSRNTSVDKFWNDSYFINFYILETFLNVSCLIQLAFFQIQTRYHSVEIRMVFSLTKTIHTTYIRSKFAKHPMQ